MTLIIFCGPRKVRNFLDLIRTSMTKALMKCDLVTSPCQDTFTPLHRPSKSPEQLTFQRAVLATSARLHEPGCILGSAYLVARNPPPLHNIGSFRLNLISLALDEFCNVISQFGFIQLSQNRSIPVGLLQGTSLTRNTNPPIWLGSPFCY